MNAKVIRCQRCSRRLRNLAGGGAWNATFRNGAAVSFLCPDCQTPQENAEAEIKAATIDYSRARLDQFGRLWAPHI